MVHPVCVAGNTIVVFPILLSEKAHNHTLVSCRASSAGRCVDLDGVDENLAGLRRAFVGIYIADWVDCAENMFICKRGKLNGKVPKKPWPFVCLLVTKSCRRLAQVVGSWEAAGEDSFGFKGFL